MVWFWFGSGVLHSHHDDPRWNWGAENATLACLGNDTVSATSNFVCEEAPCPSPTMHPLPDQNAEFSASCWPPQDWSAGEGEGDWEGDWAGEGEGGGTTFLGEGDGGADGQHSWMGGEGESDEAYDGDADGDGDNGYFGAITTSSFLQHQRGNLKEQERRRYLYSPQPGTNAGNVASHPSGRTSLPMGPPVPPPQGTGVGQFAPSQQQQFAMGGHVPQTGGGGGAVPPLHTSGDASPGGSQYVGGAPPQHGMMVLSPMPQTSAAPAGPSQLQQPSSHPAHSAQPHPGHQHSHAVAALPGKLTNLNPK